MLRRGRTEDASGLRKCGEAAAAATTFPAAGRGEKENADRQKSAADSADPAHSGAAAGSRDETDKELTAPPRLAAAREETACVRPPPTSDVPELASQNEPEVLLPAESASVIVLRLL
ncbi:hypothetical protein MRX96_033841 [Rhipicephalus microplus]